jgi:uncharacterized protein (DUF111 family)
VRSEVVRGGIGACKVDVEVSDTADTRTWSDVRALLERADLADAVRRTALDVFSRLAAAEGPCTGCRPTRCTSTRSARWTRSRTSSGSPPGCTRSGWSAAGGHGLARVRDHPRRARPAAGARRPAVLALLRGVPVQAGPAPYELTTPTGAALLAATVTRWGRCRR